MMCYPSYLPQSVKFISQNSETAFVIILDLAEKTHTPFAEVVRWLKAPHFNVIPLPPSVCAKCPANDE